MSVITGHLPLEVAAPPFRSSAYGLLSVAAVSENVGLRPLAGGVFLSGAAGEASGGVLGTTGADACDPLNNSGAGGVAKGQNLTDDWVDSLAIALWGWWACAPVGYTFEEGAQRARTPFLAGESRSLERILWDVWTTAACTAQATLVEALAGAEELIADSYGGEGVIHVNRGTATMLNAAGASLSRVGSSLRTTSYTPVVVGDGYADRGTIVATGPLSVVRGALMDLTPEQTGVNRSTNALNAVVERAYLVSVDMPAACFSAP